MRDRQLENILRAHGVRTEWRSGRLYAYDAWTNPDGTPGGEWLEASGHGKKWLMWFLQY